MAWELVPCLVQLRTELNRIAPGRDRSSDGTIGNAAHQQHVSDHNDDEVGKVPIRDADGKHEVHAYDADRDLRMFGLTMEMIVQHILARCRSGAEKRLRYIIFNRRIWEASNGWRQRAYSGDNAHTEHAHFSASYETKLEASTASWRLEDIPVALTKADLDKIISAIDTRADSTDAMIKQEIATIRAEFGQIPAEVLTARIGDPDNPAREVRNNLVDLSGLRGYLVAAPEFSGHTHEQWATSPLKRIVDAADKILKEDTP